MGMGYLLLVSSKYRSSGLAKSVRVHVLDYHLFCQRPNIVTLLALSVDCFQLKSVTKRKSLEVAINTNNSYSGFMVTELIFYDVKSHKRNNCKPPQYVTQLELIGPSDHCKHYRG